MIKFIATDLDGTLLDDERRLPDGIFELIEALWARGVLFAPASGRQYASLKRFFAPVLDKVVFVCENGALVKYRGKTLHLNPIPDQEAKEALDAVRATPHLRPMLCGTESSYIENDEQPFRDYAFASYDACVKVENLETVIGKEPICKIAVFDEIAAAENGIRVLPPKLPRLRTIQSGRDWCDVSAQTADKGEAIRFLRGHFSFDKSECVAFGDHMNDYEMLCECGRAYVTENAYPPLKKLIADTVPSNREGGVAYKLREILKEISL